jgi:hypothetical protein
MFTTPCFIRKNNKGLRNKLKGLGYAKCMTIGNGKSYITISNNNDERNGSYSIVSADVVNIIFILNCLYGLKIYRRTSGDSCVIQYGYGMCA